MSAKKSVAPTSQQTLFEGFDFDPREYASPQPYVPWQEYSDAKKVSQVTSPERGPAVDIEERDLALVGVLKHLARASMLHGLEHANETPRRQEIAERYGKDYHGLISNSKDAAMDAEIDARSEFRTAFGYEQLAKAIGGVAAAEIHVDVYDAFRDRYEGSKGNKSRAALRKEIDKRQKARQMNSFTRQALRGFKHDGPA
jgi:hypothetical protein